MISFELQGITKGGSFTIDGTERYITWKTKNWSIIPGQKEQQQVGGKRNVFLFLLLPLLYLFPSLRFLDFVLVCYKGIPWIVSCPSEAGWING